MSSTHLVRRYWDAVTTVNNPVAETFRARAGYTLLQRYWASLTRYRLPERNSGCLSERPRTWTGLVPVLKA